MKKIGKEKEDSHNNHYLLFQLLKKTNKEVTLFNRIFLH